MLKIAKIISASVYGIGVIITAVLLFTAIFGSAEMSDPAVYMLPMSQRERAVAQLTLGSVPMLGACFAVCWFWRVGDGAGTPWQKWRRYAAVFLPGIVCEVCAAVEIVPWVIGFAGMILRFIFGGVLLADTAQSFTVITAGF